MRIFEILTILTDLNGRVEDIASASADPTVHELVSFSGFAAFPLLQFNNNRVVGVAAIAAALFSLRTGRPPPPAGAPTAAGVSSATRMRAGSLTSVEYTRGRRCGWNRQIGSRPSCWPHRSVDWCAAWRSGWSPAYGMAAGFALGALVPNEVWPYQWLPLLPLILVLAVRTIERRRWVTLGVLAVCLLGFYRQPCDLFFPNLWTVAAIGVFVLALWENRLFRFEVSSSSRSE